MPDHLQSVLYYSRNPIAVGVVVGDLGVNLGHKKTVVNMITRAARIKKVVDIISFCKE